MPMKRRAILFFLLFLLQMGSVPTLAAEPTVAAQGAALIDGKTGRLLWGKNADAPLAMASTTKIMTAILVLERASLTEVVTVSKNAACAPWSLLPVSARNTRPKRYAPQAQPVRP